MTTATLPLPTKRFAALNVVQGAFVGGFPLLFPSASPVTDVALAGLGVLMLATAPALLFAGARGVAFARLACLVHVLAGAALVVLLGASAGYLWGIYGELGKTLGIVAGGIAVLVAVVFWLLPAHELHALRAPKA